MPHLTNTAAQLRCWYSFNNATRANLGGLKHSERIFLGLALLHRYKNKREGTPFDDLFGLVEERDLTRWGDRFDESRSGDAPESAPEDLCKLCVELGLGGDYGSQEHGEVAPMRRDLSGEASTWSATAFMRPRIFAGS